MICQRNDRSRILRNGAGSPAGKPRGKTPSRDRLGIPWEAAREHHCEATTHVFSWLNHLRAQRILELPLDCVRSAEFAEANASEKILAPLPAPAVTARKTSRPTGLPPYVTNLYAVPLLTRAQEVHLFRQYNYLKYRARQLRERLIPAQPQPHLMDEIEQLYHHAVEVRNRIVEANLRLVVSIAKRYLGKGGEFFELVSDGNVSLLRAVEKFDYARGNKFSTYATWAIVKNFSREVPREGRHRERFRTGLNEQLFTKPSHRSCQYAEEMDLRQRRTGIQRLLRHLNERERWIIQRRFGLGEGQEAQTLEQIARLLNLTKERIRQLQLRAMNKLRQAAQDEPLDLPSA